MSLANLFGFSSSSTAADELPEIFPLSVTQAAFVETDIMAVYAKILTDVSERMHGLSEEKAVLLWDNCVKSSKCDGLITMLAKAMADKDELFLVYESVANVVRVATSDEVTKIRADYLKTASSSVGVFVSFKNYRRSDMVKLYSALDYCTVSALYKSQNLSKAIQIKMSEMRSSVGLADAAIAKAQGLSIATGLSNGKDVMLDAKDSIETAVPDLNAAKESMILLNQKRAFYLNLPASYITGEQTGGLNATGDADQKAVERGLKNYFFSIMKPVVEALFGGSLTYKSQDVGQIEGSMDVLKTFSMTDNEIVSLENKTLIMNRLLDLPEDATGDAPKKTEPIAPPVAEVPPAKP